MGEQHHAYDSFEEFLQTAAVNLEILLPEMFDQEPCDFYLNPRYLRGSDFLMRWSQGRWAEDIVVRAINATGEFRAVPYGPSSVAPSDPQEMEQYFERLDRAGATGKRPDLLILSRREYQKIRRQLDTLGLDNIPFTPEESLRFLLSTALIAVEVETSLWVAKQMPDYGKGKPLTRQGRPDLIGFAKDKKVPTVIIKDEDLEPLQQWETRWRVPIFVFHVFYDQAYYISLQRVRWLISEGIINRTRQTFYAPGGPTTSKWIYKIWYTLAHPLGTVTRPPEMVAKFVQDKNGHILPYVHFSGGEMTLSKEILGELRSRLR
ncbi:Type-2 restriction enzyme AccI [bacterium HR08]|nr:Type-2 restriction enzyme AccI [bacterium HR08]